MGDISDLLLNPSKPNYGGKKGGSKPVRGGQVKHHSGGGGPVNTSGPSFSSPSRGGGGGDRFSHNVYGGGGPSPSSQAQRSSYSAQRSIARTLQPFKGDLYQEPKKGAPHDRGLFDFTFFGSPGDLFGKDDTKGKPAAKEEDLTPAERYAPRRTYQMSRKAFGRLDEEQKAAVRFNTLLIEAREKDLDMQGKYTPDDAQKDAYREQVRKMFGERGGSSTFAPETVSVLRQIDFDKLGDDLDDYLGLRRAVSWADLRGLREKQRRVPLITSGFEVFQPGSREERVDIASKLAAKLAEARERMARKGRLMTSFENSAALGRNNSLLKLGGEINIRKPELGFGSPSDRRPDRASIDAAIRNLFSGTANVNADPLKQATSWGLWNTVARPGEKNALFRYADTRTRLAQEFDLPLLKTKGIKTRTPEQYRKFLRLGQRTGDE